MEVSQLYLFFEMTRAGPRKGRYNEGQQKEYIINHVDCNHVDVNNDGWLRRR